VLSLILLAAISLPAAPAEEPAVSTSADRVVSAAIGSFTHGEEPREPALRGVVIGVWADLDAGYVDAGKLMTGSDFNLLVAQHLYHLVHAAKGTVVVCPAESPSFVSPPAVFREKRCDLVVGIRVRTAGSTTRGGMAEPRLPAISAALEAALAQALAPTSVVRDALPAALDMNIPAVSVFPVASADAAGGRTALRRAARDEAGKIYRGLAEFVGAHREALRADDEPKAGDGESGGDVPSYPRITGESRQASIARQLAGGAPLAADRVEWFVGMFARVAPNDRTLVTFVPKVERDGETVVLRGTTNVPSLIGGIVGALKAVGVDQVRNDITPLPRREVLADKLFGACRVSTALVYDKPSATGGVVTQLLYGEPVFLLDEAGGWLQLHAGDGYVGWVRGEAIARLDADTFDRYRAHERVVLVAELPADPATGRPELPRGARLAVVETAADHVVAQAAGESRFPVPREAIRPLPADPAADARAVAALDMLHTPYKWGGRSPLGLDCSGLITNVGGQTGANPPRDAWQQALVGELVATEWHRTGIRRGDLLYFIDATGRVYHTGIALSPTHFVHAAVPEVQIGSFDKADRLYDRRLDTTFFLAKRP
jgi:cell wall-associated NlpC family hydrolase